MISDKKIFQDFGMKAKQVEASTRFIKLSITCDESGKENTTFSYNHNIIITRTTPDVISDHNLEINTSPCTETLYSRVQKRPPVEILLFCLCFECNANFSITFITNDNNSSTVVKNVHEFP